MALVKGGKEDYLRGTTAIEALHLGRNSGLNTQYNKGKSGFTVKEQGRVSGWKITERKASGGRGILAKLV